jgi:hypothetical protein
VSVLAGKAGERMRRIGVFFVCAALYGTAAVVMPDGDAWHKLAALILAALGGVVQWNAYDD